jgi:hypothetical protein
MVNTFSVSQGVITAGATLEGSITFAGSDVGSVLMMGHSDDPGPTSLTVTSYAKQKDLNGNTTYAALVRNDSGRDINWAFTGVYNF